MIFVTSEQRQVLQDEHVPMPLIDAETGTCYMVMPVEFSGDESGIVRARIPGFAAVSEAEQASDAAMTLAVLIRKMLE